jgi:type IV pilus assembly protein PilX
MTRQNLFVRHDATRVRQRGVVLFIALIVMVALSLAAIALIRSVDTTNTVLGNLGFRQASILPANMAVEKAAAALFSDADILGAVRIPDHAVSALGENYFANRLGTDDARGVPGLLQKKSAFDGAGLQTLHDAKTHTDVRYVIERMCAGPGAPTVGNCDLLPPKINPGTTIGDTSIVLSNVPFYRVTVRVDGPQNTASFVQAMLR